MIFQAFNQIKTRIRHQILVISHWLKYISDLKRRMDRIISLTKGYKSKKTLEDLNEYCLLEIIDRLPLKDRFRFRQNRRLKYLVECNLRQVKGIRIGRNVRICKDDRHSSLLLDVQYLIFNDLFVLEDQNQSILQMIFNFCPNIKCIEMSAEIDFRTLVWIKFNCKQLECLQLNNSAISSRLTPLRWHQIGQTLSDSLIHLSLDKITNFERLSEVGLISLLDKLTLLTELSFDVNEMTLVKIPTFFGPNIKTLKLRKCYKTKLTQIDFNVLKDNLKNLENLHLEGYDYEALDLICDNFPHLKSLNMFFFSSWQNMDSLSQLSKLVDVQHLTIEFYQNRGVINYLSRNVFPKLQSLNLTGISFTPLIFDSFEEYFPNIEKLVLHNCSLLCDDRSDDFHHRQDCDDCKRKVWKNLSKLKHLKQLSVNLLPRKDTGFSKSYVWKLNEMSFPAIEELDFLWLPYDYKTFMDNLMTPLIKFAAKNPKRFIKLKINSDFFEYVSKKRQILGVKYNVLSPNIPRNLKIINSYPRYSPSYN